MKRLLKLAVVAAFALSAITVGAPASAQQATGTCEIGFTGPNSQNMCTSTTTYTCTVTNTNTVTITNNSNQDAVSGQVVVSGNGSGGGAQSGTVTNNNGTVFSVVITNPDPLSQNNGTCTATVTVPATEPPAPVIPTGTGQVEALPKTSGDTTLQTFMTIVLAALGVAALSIGGVLWYRTQKSL